MGALGITESYACMLPVVFPLVSKIDEFPEKEACRDSL